MLLWNLKAHNDVVNAVNVVNPFHIFVRINPTQILTLLYYIYMQIISE
jgi:hypothetical protein